MHSQAEKADVFQAIADPTRREPLARLKDWLAYYEMFRSGKLSMLQASTESKRRAEPDWRTAKDRPVSAQPIP